MIIENLNSIRDFILNYQKYFDRGYADVKLVDDTQRDGIFLVDQNGEHSYALQFDYNTFYLRRIGSISVTGDVASGLLLQVGVRLVAQASDVDQYEMLECLVSSLVTKCGNVGITNIELNPQTIFRNEGMTRDRINAMLSRSTGKQFVQIDFSYFEVFNPTDVVNCTCNPCKTC